MTNSEKLPKPNMDIFEVDSTMKFIAECKKEGVDCHELEEYIQPLINSKRVNLGHGEITESRDNH
jgi:hypothetical protein